MVEKVQLRAYNYRRRFPEWLDPPKSCPLCGYDVILLDRTADDRGQWWSVKYRCLGCEAYVGTHPHSVYPLGTLADADLRKRRMAVHRAIDYLWKDCDWERNKVYALMSRLMSTQDFHVGHLSKAECSQALKVFREWEMKADFGEP